MADDDDAVRFERSPVDQSTDDTEGGWGEIEPDDDLERLTREKPPHHCE